MSNPITSAIGEESGDPYRESDIRYYLNVDATTFQNVIDVSLLRSQENYDLNDYNCTNYGIDVFNTALPMANQLNHVTRPNSLFNVLNNMTNSGIYRAKIEGGNLPSSTNCN